MIIYEYKYSIMQQNINKYAFKKFINRTNLSTNVSDERDKEFMTNISQICINEPEIHLPTDFNWENYRKLFPEINNEVLARKHYTEKLEIKNNTEQILNIIIIKRSNTPISAVLPEINNMDLTISLISDHIDPIEHYNIKKYNSNNLIYKVNEAIKYNTSKYYTIIFDNYILDKLFPKNICRELNDSYNIDNLLLIQDKKIRTSDKTEYFYTSYNNLKKLRQPYIMIFNSDNKMRFDYSLNEIGLILYANQVSFNKTILTSVDFNYRIINNNNDIKLLSDTLKLFSIFTDNIENEIIGEKNIIDLSDLEKEPEDELMNDLIYYNINKIKNPVKINNMLELNLLLRNKS